MAQQCESVLDSQAINRTIARMAAEIAEAGDERLILVGIHTRGVPLAERIAEHLRRASVGVEVGKLDIALYRDDVGPWRQASAQPILHSTELPPIDDQTIILVDDVLYTGRTVRAAIDALLDYGRPRRVRLAVLVDRGHRELPIAADFIGKRIDTGADDEIRVQLAETDELDEVVYCRGGA